MDVLTIRHFAELAGLWPSALLLLDRAGHVHYANPAAEALLVRTSMLSVKGGALSARRKDEDKALRDAWSGLSATLPSTTLCLRNRESLPMVVMDLQLLATDAVALRITDLVARPAPSVARLKQLFGLTPAEARVAIAMLSGLGIQDVAREHGVEAETVRTQTKRIRSKTGTKTQTQLVSLLAAVVEGFTASPNG